MDVLRIANEIPVALVHQINRLKSGHWIRRKCEVQRPVTKFRNTTLPCQPGHFRQRFRILMPIQREVNKDYPFATSEK